MEIVVNDTNILIDLYNAGLLDCCKQLDLPEDISVMVYAQENHYRLLTGDKTLRIWVAVGGGVGAAFPYRCFEGTV